MTERITEFVREECPVCGHRRWCGRRGDGLVLCKRPPDPRAVPGYSFQGMASDGATAMYVESGREYANSRITTTTRSFRKSKAKSANKKDTLKPIQELHAKFVAQLDDERHQALADVLKLPPDALNVIEIGWCSDRRWWNPETQQEEGEPGCWTFPERDAQSRIIGIGLRFLNGRKGQVRGGKRGLTLSIGWKEKTDPVIVTEGPSDVIAGCALGLNVVGRPSNSGGADLLIHLFRNRKVIVLGENDRKGDGSWPGAFGAKSVASKLRSLWARPVPIALPPDGAKDLREWFLRYYAGQDGDGLKALGVEFLRNLNIREVQFVADARTGRSSRVVVKAFRWTGNVADEPIHTDRIDLAEFRDRRRFANAVVQLEPTADAEELQTRLATVEVPEPQKREGARRVASGFSPLTSAAGSTSTRGRIQANERQLCHIREEAIRALSSHNEPPRLFSRDNQIVRVVTTYDPLGHAVPVIQSLDDVALRGELSDAADWYLVRRTRDGAGTEVDDLPPMAVARDILRLPQSLLPPLQGIIHCPTFTADGSLIINEGYDSASGLWHHPTLKELRQVPEQPSADQIRHARELLLDLFVDFPFVDQPSRANTLGLLLLAFARPLISGPTPCHAIDAPTAGTGKDLLAKAATFAALGFEVGAMTAAKDPDEWRKKITAALASGSSVILWGNIASRLDNEHFAAVLTEVIWRDRELGSTRSLVLPNRAVWVATGNNLSFSKEITRRVVWIRLDSKLETPETRSGFKHPDLLSYVRDHRAPLVHAALTLIRAWLAAGRPMGTQVMGSFESYARVMGGILDVAGVAGFLGNADALRQRTHGESSEWRAFVFAWWVRWQDKPLGVCELAHLLWDRAGERSDLLLSVITSDSKHGVLTQLGMKLAAKRDAVIAGYRIAQEDEKDRSGRLTYRLHQCETQTLKSNDAGLQKACTRVCTSNSSFDNDLARGADPCIPFSVPHAHVREQFNAHSDARVNGAHMYSEGEAKRSAKVCIRPEITQASPLTRADPIAGLGRRSGRRQYHFGCSYVSHHAAFARVWWPTSAAWWRTNCGIANSFQRLEAIARECSTSRSVYGDC